jgi:hypothetical protein
MQNLLNKFISRIKVTVSLKFDEPIRRAFLGHEYYYQIQSAHICVIPSNPWLL